MLIAESDRTRAGYIRGLRMLADLLEQVPEVPYYEYGSISFALGGSEAEAFEVIERAAEALALAGIEFEHDGLGSRRRLEIVLAGVRYGFSKLSDTAYQDLKARTSYEKNVQVA